MAKQKGPDLSPHIDLHMHTHYGESCSLTKPEALVHHTVEQGRTAVGVADLNSVQAFPELEKQGRRMASRFFTVLKRLCKMTLMQKPGIPHCPPLPCLPKTKPG